MFHNTVKQKKNTVPKFPLPHQARFGHNGEMDMEDWKWTSVAQAAQSMGSTREGWQAPPDQPWPVMKTQTDPQEELGLVDTLKENLEHLELGKAHLSLSNPELIEHTFANSSSCGGSQRIWRSRQGSAASLKWSAVSRQGQQLQTVRPRAKVIIEAHVGELGIFARESLGERRPILQTQFTGPDQGERQGALQNTRHHP